MMHLLQTLSVDKSRNKHVLHAVYYSSIATIEHVVQAMKCSEQFLLHLAKVEVKDTKAFFFFFRRALLSVCTVRQDERLMNY